MVPYQPVYPTFAPAGTSAIIVAPAPLLGSIMQARVIQNAGTPEGFTWAIYRSRNACVLDGAGAPTGSLSATAELYRICPDQVVAAAADGSLVDNFNVGWPYQILDPATNLPSNAMYDSNLFIHLAIVNAYAGKTFVPVLSFLKAQTSS